MSVLTHSWHPHLAPRCKLRGKRRYFRRLTERASGFRLDVRADSWWDLWHYHADWRGWGNRGLSYRRPHVDALCRVFRQVASQGASFATSFQAWLLLSDEDAGHDAAYLHTPNLNATQFPLELPHINICDTAYSPLLRSLLPEFQLHFGWSEAANNETTDRSAIHWVWAENVGTPLWSV